MLAALALDLRQMLRDWWLLAFSLLGPIAVITLIAAALLGDGDGPRLSIPVVDEDGGPAARELAAVLAEHAEVVPLDREAATHFVAVRHAGPVAIVFPQGLSENYRRGRPTEVPVLTDPAHENELVAARTLLLFLETRARALADPFAEETITIEERNLTGTRLEVSSFERHVPGFAVMFVLVAVVFSTALGLHDELEWGTLPRLLIAPNGMTPVLLGKLGARCVVGALQMLILLAWSRAALGVTVGTSPAAVVAVTCGVILPTVATGLLVAALTRSREQAQALALAAVMVLSGLGGLWWDQSMAPDWMRAAAPVAYTTWAMQALDDLVLRDRGLAAVAGAVTVTTLQALCMLGPGLWLFRVRHGVR